MNETASTRWPSGPAHDGRMRSSTSILLAALAALSLTTTACGGASRQDPEPAGCGDGKSQACAGKPAPAKPTDGKVSTPPAKAEPPPAETPPVK